MARANLKIFNLVLILVRNIEVKMKLTHLALGIAGACLSLASLAATVSTSSNISFLAVDGQKAKTVLQGSKSFDATANEPHQVVIRVSDIIRQGSNRHLYESKPIIVKFVGQNDNIVITAPDLKTTNDVAKFEKNPEITIISNNGNTVKSSQDVLITQGFLPEKQLVETLSAYNNSNAKASVPSLALAVLPGNMNVFSQVSNDKSMQNKVVVQGQNIAEQQLQYWYQQADKATQQRFMKWAEKMSK